VNTHSESSIPH